MLFKKKEKNELDIIGMLTEKDRIKRYTFLVVGCFLTAVAFNLFFEPYSLCMDRYIEEDGNLNWGQFGLDIMYFDSQKPC